MVRILHLAFCIPQIETRCFGVIEQPFSKLQNHTFIDAAMASIKAITDVNFLRIAVFDLFEKCIVDCLIGGSSI